MVLKKIWEWIEKSFPVANKAAFTKIPVSLPLNCNEGYFIPFIFVGKDVKEMIGLVYCDYWNQILKYQAEKGQFFFIFDSELCGIRFNKDLEAIKDFRERSKILQDILLDWKRDGLFAHALERGWRDEQVEVILFPTNQCIFTMERGAIGIFGFMAQGVHMNALVMGAERDFEISSSQRNLIDQLFEQETEIKDLWLSKSSPLMWVAVRSSKKEHYPHHYDQMVAGGLVANKSIWENLEKEAMEEAGLDISANTVANRPVGCVNCWQWIKEGRGLHREVMFIYDTIVADPNVFRPCNQDGEVAATELASMPRLLEILLSDTQTFSPHAGLVVIDFWMRKGFLDPTCDPVNYIRISSFLGQDLTLGGGGAQYPVVIDTRLKQ